MLVCQCNIISDREIKRVILALLADDPWKLIVPAMVYAELQKRCKCAGCVPNVVDIVIAVTEEYHRNLADRPADAPPVVHPRLVAMQRKHRGGVDEG